MKTPKENVVSVLTGKKCLFVENDGSLENGLDEMEKILMSNNIEYSKILYAETKPIARIIDAIRDCDALIFMTQWRTDTSKLLFKYVSSLEVKKIIIEVFIYEPHWYYASQHGTIHDVYIYQHQRFSERFLKLTEKAYWDYENEFDA